MGTVDPTREFEVLVKLVEMDPSHSFVILAVDGSEGVIV